MRLKHQAGQVNTTKFVPPGKRAELVVGRTGVAGRIAQHAQCRLILVHAPAGYGKTSVLAHIHGLRLVGGEQVGWLSVDEEDNDLARFLVHFIEAMRRDGSPVGLATLALLRSGVTLPMQVLKSTLLSELAALPEDYTVFVDDFHLVDDHNVTGLLTAILLAPLPRFRLVIATRDSGSLPIARLRLQDEILELGVEDLKFSRPEAEELLNRQNGKRLDRDVIDLLVDRTEGWAAGLQFAAITLRDTEEANSNLPALHGDRANAGRFLVDEVLRRQSADVQEFLLATCILRRFNTQLCQAVTGRPDARKMLDALESRSLFIFSLDNEHQWYRYHHLFSEFLQRHLVEYRAAQRTQLHLRACQWLEAEGFVIEALEHAMAAGDEALAARLLDESSPQLFARGQIATIRAWEAKLSPAMAARCVELQLELAWDFELRWQFSEARGALKKARQALNSPSGVCEGSNDPRSEFLTTKLAHRELMLMLLSDQAAETEALCRCWLAQSDGSERFMHASTETALMWSRRERYEVQGAAAATEMTHDLFLRGGAIYGTAFHNTIAGATLFAAGHLAQAEQVLARGRDWARQIHGEGSALMAMPSMVMAELLYEKNRLDEVRQLLALHYPQARELGFVDNLIAGFITAARLAFHDGQVDRAMAILDEAQHFAGRFQFERLNAHALCERVRQCLALGDLSAAVALLPGCRSNEWIQKYALGQNATTTQELMAIAHARAWGDLGHQAEALAVLRHWLVHAKQRNVVRSSVRISVLLCRLSAQQGHAAAARRYLIDALEFGAAAGFVRSFVDEGPIVLEQLAALHATPRGLTSTHLAVVNAILAVANCGSNGGPGSGKSLEVTACEVGNSEPGLGTSLSQREMKIIQLAADSLANSEVGAALGLTESTVKWYWQRIFAKFGVHRRSSVIQRARSLGLLKLDRP